MPKAAVKDEEFGVKHKVELMTIGLLENTIRQGARSDLKAEISQAAKPLRELAGGRVGPLYREIGKTLDGVESQIYQALIADAERRAVLGFVDDARKVHEAVEAMTVRS